MSIFFQHLPYVIKFPKHCNVCSTAVRPFYVQVNVQVWTEKVEEQKLLVTSMSQKLKYSNNIICNAMIQVAFTIRKKFNLKLIQTDRSPSYRTLTQISKAIFYFVIHLFQIWTYVYTIV
jgi:predicted molibdopterin-dependent oxidoreductase YjgC